MKNLKVGKTFAQVDDEDYPVLNRLKWNISISTGRPSTAFWEDGEKRIDIVKLLKPYKVNYKIVNMDKNPLNCQKYNLIYQTATELIQSAQKREKTTSKFKGVCYCKERNGGKWLARINKDGKKYFLGYYQTQVEAALAYNNKAEELYGNKAFFNLIRLLRREPKCPPTK